MKPSMNHANAADEPRCAAPGITADLKAYADNELTVLRRRTVSAPSAAVCCLPHGDQCHDHHS
jgi:hypothetical protein